MVCPHGTEVTSDWLTEARFEVFLILLSIFVLIPLPIRAHSYPLLLTLARADTRISTGE